MGSACENSPHYARRMCVLFRCMCFSDVCYSQQIVFNHSLIYVILNNLFFIIPSKENIFLKHSQHTKEKNWNGELIFTKWEHLRPGWERGKKRTRSPLSELGVSGESTHLSTRALYSDHLPGIIDQLQYEWKDQGLETTKHNSGALNTFSVV